MTTPWIPKDETWERAEEALKQELGPAEPLPSRHCKRCHENTNEEPLKHNKICGGFTSECWPWCSYPTTDDRIKELQS
jgi:hypothetical protein